ncbi:anion transporter [Azohydromonas caseinilytica]|uniref:Anion transporter n=1 Tax=Azohydromonas caseinilytica TaxID=2728836 RepID=A0A848FAV5_9BURK|nr:anion transporter [Azohydromonas caseinilytica]NML15885.1 anion transporter [Azohydromonas caseinilytica]
MTDFVLLIFSLVYLGMILGGLPFLQLDRSGVALLGAIALIGAEAVSVEEAAQAIHLPTLLLLFAFMVISAQMRLGGFYDAVARWLAALRVTPMALLGALIAVSAVLSAVFSNDVVCLAMAPVLVDVCRRRGRDALPYLLALACSANIGSAATLIGNPQNMLIGAQLKLPFGGYVLQVLPAVLLSLAATWVLIGALMRARLQHAPRAVAGASIPAPAPDEDIPFSRWQAAKGLSVALGVLLCFLFAPWPREVVALAGAGLLLLSRRLHSRDMLGLVDWQLLVLFMGLFVVNHALQATELPEALVRRLAETGWRLDHPASLFGATFVLSNLVSNVPAVMLLLPLSGPDAGPLLALVSTLAGNLFVVGSIANIIVVDAAARHGVAIDWRTHARIGVPVTVASLAVCAGWLAWR